MSKRRAPEASSSSSDNRGPLAAVAHRTVSQRVYDPATAVVLPSDQINRLDPRDEEERLNASERVRDVDVLIYEDGLEKARQRVEDDEEQVANVLDEPLPPQRVGVEIEALQGLVPATRGILRRNDYIRALVRCIQMTVWFKDHAQVRSHLLAAGLEVERTDRAGRLLCSPALHEEKHAHDNDKLSQIEVEQRQREAERQQEADVEYTLAQLAQQTGAHLTFEEREEIETIIEDALEVVVELEEDADRGIRISKWSVGVV